MNETAKNIVVKDDLWKRALYIVLFLFINSLLKTIVLAASITQFLFLAIKGESNRFIADFSQGLSNYSYRLTRYVTCLSDDKPFPFSPWDDREPRSR
ncbi:MAG: DUF4389 domain-containing protein [Gammaproteobacteria bacterium]|nr:DUF4389 domain-containing protein [Gammaproteobacteria bacterium]